MDEFDEIKAALDQELLKTDSNIGIAFSVDLFEVFRQKGWFTLELFTVFDILALSHNVPTYKKTHFVFSTWDIADYGYKVGKRV